MRKCVNVAAIKLRSLLDNSIFGWEPSSIVKIVPPLLLLELLLPFDDDIFVDATVVNDDDDEDCGVVGRKWIWEEIH